VSPIAADATADPSGPAGVPGTSADWSGETALPPPPDPRDPSSRYAFIGAIGRGGMGEVHRVHDRVLNRVVAMKTLRREYAGHLELNARFLEEAQIALAGVWWQTALIVFALIVLAPLGEEILFRALELRGLVRLIPFAVAAPISGLLFTAAHYDAWVAWPRTLALVATGWALAWLYRWRGIPATITAHATVNTVAAIALIIQQ
jgi:hypothetical protein